MNIFLDQNNDPSLVIGLIPSFLPSEAQKYLNYPDELPELTDDDFQRAVLALTGFLTQKRNDLAKEDSEEVESVSLEGTLMVKSRLELQQIVDTYLLRCHVETNSDQAKSLLLHENNCSLSECVTVLERHGKLEELVMLCRQKAEHSMALELLKEHSTKQNSPISNPKHAIDYLTQLSHQHMDLILSHSSWVIARNLHAGLQIFVKDCEEVKAWPRNTVLEHLQKNAEDLVLPYLQHVVNVWKDEESLFHLELARQYIKQILRLVKEHEPVLPLAKPGSEPMAILDMRVKLIELIQTFKDPQLLFNHLSLDELPWERAILLERLGMHEEVLKIYALTFNDNDTALEY